MKYFKALEAGHKVCGKKMFWLQNFLGKVVVSKYCKTIKSYKKSNLNCKRVTQNAWMMSKTESKLQNYIMSENLI